MDKTVIELFAGVGGFRVGLNKIKEFDDNGQAIEKGDFKFVWANQWEPSTKAQYAFDCYKERFKSQENEYSNQDITIIDKTQIPDHTLLCGGFPCQDYSVAHSLTKEKGIEGKKGVLWWQIDEIIKEKKPPFILLENVDRLIKSPAIQRGRDFGIMLRCLNDRGYDVEWRVINAANYGFPQRRRRIFIFASKRDTLYASCLEKKSVQNVLYKDGIFSKTFKVQHIYQDIKSVNIVDEYQDLVSLSNDFYAKFFNTGIMIKGNVYTVDTTPVLKKPILLKDILFDKVDNHYYLSKERIQKFEYLRGSKKIPRVKPNGDKYLYSEGSMKPFDAKELPGRTMLTSEGSMNRSTHIIKDENGIRILTPVECERLNQFPDNWTNMMPERKRYFMMGNALVCGIIQSLGNKINKIIDDEQ